MGEETRTASAKSRGDMVLLFSIALYVLSKSWKNFAAHFFQQFGDIGNVIYDEGVMDDGLDESSNEKLDDDEDDLVINMIRI
uniref:Uncharacterized protein n=1 Tax=Rhizophagus irregularis (strain DAOM 181602 / DAOM 197198 / MUCL 43194) TaxID=747089 RepID=U9SLT3_RHIID